MELPVDSVRSGLQKVAEGRHAELTTNEIFGLEAMLLPQNRPVTFIRGGSYDGLGDPWRRLQRSRRQSEDQPAAAAYGRIELPRSPIVPYAGTGFVVGNGLIATNRHVAQLFSQGLGLSIRYQAGDAAIDLKRQVDTPDNEDSPKVVVLGVEMIHPYWDMALLKVAGLPTRNALRLSIKSPEELTGRNVVVSDIRQETIGAILPCKIVFLARSIT